MIVGCMSPDFEYFVHLRTWRTIGHTPLGILVMDLPASLAVLWVFHRVVKRPLLFLVPERYDHLAAVADTPFRFGPVGRFVAICASILLGAVSHVAWDSLTHSNGWVVERVPFLSERFFKSTGAPVPLYSLLQIASGVVGLLFLGVWFLHWARRQQPGASRPRLPAHWQIACTLSFVAWSTAMGVANSVRFDSLRAMARTVERRLATGVVGAIAGLCVIVVVYALVVAILEAKGRLPLTSRRDV